MRTNRILWASLSLVLCFVGTYVLLDSVYNPGEFGEAGILLGGTLISLALFTTGVAVQQHLQMKALAKHMGHGSHHRRDSRLTRV